MLRDLDSIQAVRITVPPMHADADAGIDPIVVTLRMPSFLGGAVGVEVAQ